MPPDKEKETGLCEFLRIYPCLVLEEQLNVPFLEPDSSVCKEMEEDREVLGQKCFLTSVIPQFIGVNMSSLSAVSS